MNNAKMLENAKNNANRNLKMQKEIQKSEKF